MLEVIPHGNGWRWRWISAEARTLFESFVCHPSDMAAFAAAKRFRAAFWALADRIDSRMGACI